MVVHGGRIHSRIGQHIAPRRNDGDAGAVATTVFFHQDRELVGAAFRQSFECLFLQRTVAGHHGIACGTDVIGPDGLV